MRESETKWEAYSDSSEESTMNEYQKIKSLKAASFGGTEGNEIRKLTSPIHYRRWARETRDYLGVQGLWGFVDPELNEEAVAAFNSGEDSTKLFDTSARMEVLNVAAGGEETVPSTPNTEGGAANENATAAAGNATAPQKKYASKLAIAKSKAKFMMIRCLGSDFEGVVKHLHDPVLIWLTLKKECNKSGDKHLQTLLANLKGALILHLIFPSL